jgi:succinyl-CoA synthetase beta subunit
MARLYEYQGKELLRKAGINVPRGGVASTPEEARKLVESLGVPCVVKAQAWVTGRASLGGIKMVETPKEAEMATRAILGMSLKGFRVEQVLVEERLAIEREFYAGVIIDDQEKCPVVIFSSRGGTGIEEIAKGHPDEVAKKHLDVRAGLTKDMAREMADKTGLDGKLQDKLAPVLAALYGVAKNYEARACEINPLVLVKGGELYAADCRVSIDDYAVFRHPELGIEIAREYDRPATDLEKIAWGVEAKDYRGTFYFIQLASGFRKGDGYIGFHGAGGGGSMMSMDAVLARGFKIATFCDTSGNPPASKVYRAARIILATGPVDGYFASGSGVASQEQFHSARGILKAFREENLSVPAVIRLGGNQEEKAMEILRAYTRDLPAPVEAYGKNDSPGFCADRLLSLLKDFKLKESKIEPRSPIPEESRYAFAIQTGEIELNHSLCLACAAKPCVWECPKVVFKIEEGKPVLAMTLEEAQKGGCTECLACEIACEFEGNKALHISLPIPGLDEYREQVRK